MSGRLVSGRVVSCGMVTLDRIHGVAAIPTVPVKVPATSYRESGGGMAATAAVAVAALGGEAIFLGRIGDDETGARVTGLLRAAGVDARLTVVAGAETPHAGILVDAAGERLAAVHTGRGLRDLSLDDPASVLAGVGAVLVDGRWPAAQGPLVAAARARGIPCVLDADTAPPADLRPLAAAVDHVVFSTRGLAAFTSESDPEHGLRVLAGRGHTTLAVTLGERGGLRLVDGAVRPIPAFATAAKDTTGAGDTYHGAFALALARGADPDAALRFAAAAAALKCARGAGWDGMPDPAGVSALLTGPT